MLTDIRDLGQNVLYATASAWQEELVATRAAEGADGRDTLLLLEHAPVYTLGRSANPAHLLPARDPRVEVARSPRGGDVTYHGPGQLVGYPVVHLRCRGLLLLEYLRMLEDVLLRTLAAFGIAGNRDARNRGVWVGNDKIAAIGIHVSRGVASHGFALNVDPDMARYAGIVPCGLAGAGVTSMRLRLGRGVDMGEVKAVCGRMFLEVFQ